MDGVSDKALLALSQYSPVIQLAVVAIMVLSAILAVVKAMKDGKSSSTDDFPRWTIIGPANDMIKNVAVLTEEHRRTNELLREQGRTLLDIKSSLELSRNESRLHR